MQFSSQPDVSNHPQCQTCSDTELVGWGYRGHSIREGFSVAEGSGLRITFASLVAE